MGAMAPVSHWMPEDDLLLKNAIEAGASLESLAKGAVQFSRRFTFVELQDRWHSLLYDPLISAEASSRMTELEHSTPNLPPKFNFSKTGNSKENKNLSGKRNGGTVRSCYLEMRKKMRLEPFDSMEDLNFLVGPSDTDYVGNTDEPLFRNGMLSDPLLSNLEFEKSHLDIIHSAFPEILADDTIEDGLNMGFHIPVEGNLLGQNEHVTDTVPAILEDNDLAFTANGHINGKLGNPCYDFEGNQVFHSPVPECGSSPSLQNVEYLSQISCEAEKKNDIVSASALHEEVRVEAKLTGTSEVDLKLQILTPTESKDPTANTENFLAELSNSLLTEDMDIDGKDMADKSYYDGLNSLLMNPTNDACVSQENMANSTETAEVSIAPEYLKDMSDGASGIEENNNEVLVSDVLSAYDPHPEIVNGVICCGLNTEDTCIPCNDDIFPVKPVRTSSSSSLVQKNSKACNSVPPTFKDFSTKKENVNPGNSILSSQMIRSQTNLEMVQPGSIAKCDGKLEFCRNNGSSQVNATYSNSTCSNTVPTMPKEKNPESVMETQSLSLKEICGDEREQDVLVTLEEQHMANAHVELEVNAATLELDEYPIDSDEELPRYPDIEAMILDMDLDPDDQDSFELEVAKYQHTDVRRAIIRLEQGAHSYMQREIACRGAFAVLYGRYSKHYIKKPEVLLGRATAEYHVDIDLGRAGSKIQVSRRQAIISLNNDGSFNIKNLGKQSIAVNDKELDPGESLKLKSNCLIEIRGMPFIFETNQACVKRFLDGKAKELTCQKPSSELGKTS